MSYHQAMTEQDGYELLRQAIARGRLSPGERLLEEELAEQLGVGRAGIRAALIRLEHEGLVERERNRGARVRRVGEKEAVEILQTRAAVEGLAAGLAAGAATAEDVAGMREVLAEMKELLAEGDLLGMSDRNAELHRRIMELADNQTAQRISAMLHSQSVRFQYRTILVPGRPSLSLQEHAAIVDAIAAGDPEAADRAMRAHLLQLADTLQRTAAERSLRDDGDLSTPLGP